MQLELVTIRDLRVADSDSAGGRIMQDSSGENEPVQDIPAPRSQKRRLEPVAHTTERKRSQHEREQYVKDLEFLSSSAAELVKFGSEANMYEFIGRKLRQLCGDSVVGVNSYDPDSSALCTRTLLGLGKRTESVIKIMGRSPVGTCFKIDEQAKAGLGRGELTKIPNGIYDLSPEIGPAVCRAIEKLLGLGDAYAMGLVWKEQLLGSVTILTRKDEDLKNRALIQTFMEQASIALQRYAAEQALQRSEAKYRTLVEQIPAVTYTAALDEASTTLYVSPQIEARIGFSPAEYAANPDIWRQRLHPDDRQRVLAEVAQSRRSGKLLASEYRMIARNGDVVWFRDQAVIVRDEDGKVLFLQGVMFDITQRKRMEKALRESAEKYRDLFENAQEAIITTDLQGKITATNRLVGEYSFKREELIGKSHFDFIAERHRAQAVEDYEKLVHGSTDEGEIELISPRGNITVEYKQNPIRSKGKIVGVQTILTDITDRKWVEEELRRSKAQIESIFDASPDAIAVTDLEARITECNRAALDMQGFSSKKDVIGRSAFDFIAEKDRERARQGLQKVLEQGSDRNVEYTFVTKDGREFPGQLSASLIRDAAGEPQAFVATIRDITNPKKAAEAALRYQNQLKLLAARLVETEERERQRIAAGLHDQIGQKLAMTKFAAQSLAESAPGSEVPAKLREICRDIDEIIEQTHSLTFELSDPVLYQVGLRPAVERWLQKEVEAKHGIKARFAPSDDPIDIDPGLRMSLFRDIRELLTNIVKHAGADTVDVTMRRTRKKLRIVIKDNGAGFSPGKQELLADEKGGFGLFSVREHIANLGGQFEIDSKPGKGTCITIKVPVY